MNLKQRLNDIVPGVAALLLLCTTLVLFMGLACHEHREAGDTWKEVTRTWQNVDKQLKEMECEKKSADEVANRKAWALGPDEEWGMSDDGESYTHVKKRR